MILQDSCKIDMGSKIIKELPKNISRSVMIMTKMYKILQDLASIWNFLSNKLVRSDLFYIQDHEKIMSKILCKIYLLGCDM